MVASLVDGFSEVTIAGAAWRVFAVSDAQHRVQVQVIDNGRGVAAADRERVFLPYYSTKGRGSGLGLAIVRRMIGDHGGTIDVTAASAAGTTFTIDLPCLPS